MRVFALSDVHVDYAQNMNWIRGLSDFDYSNDVLVLAGDISDLPHHLEEVFRQLSRRFARVLFVPGNHDLWVRRCGTRTSIGKFALIQTIAHGYGVETCAYHRGDVSIVPLLGWYDHSFGMPTAGLREVWMDYHACVWPQDLTDTQITRYFLSLNPIQETHLRRVVISFSHFLPRIDVMPGYIPRAMHYLYPVLGTSLLDEKIRSIRSTIHIYGHSHVNQEIEIEGTRYINNAFGYPSETRLTARRLKCVYDSDAEGRT